MNKKATEATIQEQQEKVAPQTLATFKNLLTSKSPTNRHERCVHNPFGCQDEGRRVAMSPVSQAINSHRPLKPIQERAADIIKHKNYRLDILKEAQAIKKKEQEDLSMKRKKTPKTPKTPRKSIKTQNSAIYNKPTTIQSLKQEMAYDKMKGQELLRNAVLRKQHRSPTTLIQRLRQLSPYERRQPDLLFDDIALGTTRRHHIHLFTPRQHQVLRQRRSITPNYNVEYPSLFSKTKHIKSNKKPNVDIRRILEQNKEQIMAYIGQVLQKQMT